MISKSRQWNPTGTYRQRLRTGVLRKTNTIKHIGSMPSLRPTSRARHWAWTLNHYTQEDLDHLMHLDITTSTIRYMIFQQETGESGTPHLQGYTQFTRAHRLTGVKKAIGIARIHCEPAARSASKNILYCSKDSDRIAGTEVVELGVPGRGGTRAGVIRSIQAGATMQELAERFPNQYMTRHHGMRALRQAYTKPRNWAPKVRIYYGNTGTGKTYTARQKHPEGIFIEWPQKNGMWWWDGYDGQEVIVLDEFRHQINYSEMLRLLDRYPHQVQVKGGFVHNSAKKIIITTNCNPATWYSEEDQEPLHRRLNDFCKIYEFQPLTFQEDGTPKVTKQRRTVQELVQETSF